PSNPSARLEHSLWDCEAPGLAVGQIRSHGWKHKDTEPQRHRENALSKIVHASSFLQTLINRLNEHIRPPNRPGSIQWAIFACGTSGLARLQCDALLAHVLHAVANDDGPLAAIDHVAEVRQTAVPGNDKRSTFLAIYRDDHIHQAIQSIDHTLDISPRSDVDDRIARCCKDVSRADDIRTPKENDAVAIGMRRGLVDYLDAFAVEEKFL